MHLLVVGEHALEDLLLRQRLAAALHQHAQHRQFSRGDSASASPCQRELAPCAVVHQRPAGQPRMLDAARAAHQRMQPSRELGQREGLGEEVVGAAH